MRAVDGGLIIIYSPWSISVRGLCDCPSASILPRPDIIVYAARESTIPAAAAVVGKALLQERVTSRAKAAAAQPRTRPLRLDINVCSAISSPDDGGLQASAVRCRQLEHNVSSRRLAAVISRQMPSILL
jgi:hypothetical protein